MCSDRLVDGGVGTVRVTDFIGYVPLANATTDLPVSVRTSGSGSSQGNVVLSPYSWMAFTESMV